MLKRIKKQFEYMLRYLSLPCTVGTYFVPWIKALIIIKVFDSRKRVNKILSQGCNP